MLGIVAGLLAGAGGAAAIAVAGGGTTSKPKLVVTGAPSPVSSVTIAVKHPPPELGGEPRGYRLGTEAPTGAIEQLGAALGVHGPVQSDAGGWVIREGDRLVRVERRPGLHWFLATLGGPCQIVPGSASPSSPSEPLQTIPPSGPTDCPAKPAEPGSTPTTGPPMALDPEGPAVKVLSAAGLGRYYAVTSTKGPSSGSVTVSPILDGRPVSGLDWTATVSAGGDITAASGFLAEPTPEQTYRLVGTTAAVATLQRAASAKAAGAPSCAPGQRCEPTARVIETIVNVRLGLVRLVDTLVPAYIFEIEGGGTQAVPAVEDRYLQ